jgi:excisionase family DNA binding protein
MDQFFFSPIPLRDLSLLIETSIEQSVRKALNESANVQIPEPETDLINIEEAAGILNLSVQTVYQLCSTRKINHFKKGKRLYFSKSELVDWIKSGRKKTRAELIT